MQLIRLTETLARTGLSRSKLYELIAAGEFPRPAKLSARTVGWLTDEIDHWIAERLADRPTN